MIKKGQLSVECDQDDVRRREQQVQRPCDGRTLNIPEAGRTTIMSKAENDIKCLWRRPSETMAV